MILFCVNNFNACSRRSYSLQFMYLYTEHLETRLAQLRAELVKVSEALRIDFGHLNFSCLQVQ
jgi:hypothetical protein